MANSKAGGATATPAEVVAEELPKSIVRRVVKEKLSSCHSSNDGGDLNLHKDALLAFSESARIFIHYLSATANDFCKESKRQTINADDVLKALEEIEFPEFTGPLKASLDDFRKKNAIKKGGATKTKEDNKKRKAEKEKPEQPEKEEETAGENEEEEDPEEEEEPMEDENGEPDD